VPAGQLLDFDPIRKAHRAYFLSTTSHTKSFQIPITIMLIVLSSGNNRECYHCAVEQHRDPPQLSRGCRRLPWVEGAAGKPPHRPPKLAALGSIGVAGGKFPSQPLQYRTGAHAPRRRALGDLHHDRQCALAPAVVAFNQEPTLHVPMFNYPIIGSTSGRPCGAQCRMLPRPVPLRLHGPRHCWCHTYAVDVRRLPDVKTLTECGCDQRADRPAF